MFGMLGINVGYAIVICCTKFLSAVCWCLSIRIKRIHMEKDMQRIYNCKLSK